MEYDALQRTIRIMDVVYSSSVDGTGFRDVLFVNYCPHRCEGCHNPATWNSSNGRDVPLREVYQNLTRSRITNITYSGGEPFEQAAELILLTEELRRNTHKTIWVYSGYTYEEILADPLKKRLLSLCDVLVDGRFDQTKTRLNLRFKGSVNQRIIDIPKSLKQGRVCLFSCEIEEGTPHTA